MQELRRGDALRLEVRRFVTACGTARALPSHLHVGRLDGPRATLAVDASYDAGLRADLLTRMLDGLEEHAGVVAWLTRGGFPTVADLDLDWAAAADAAFARHGLRETPFYVVTRHGWLEVRTGEGRTWRRVRPNRDRPDDS